MDFYFSLHFDLWVVVVWSKFGKDSEAVPGPGSFEKISDLFCGMGGGDTVDGSFTPSFAVVFLACLFLQL